MITTTSKRCAPGHARGKQGLLRCNGRRYHARCPCGWRYEGCNEADVQRCASLHRTGGNYRTGCRRAA